jgi:hypothetical protein
MKTKQTKHTEDIKPDLKHDSMEFSAAADGDDLPDTDNALDEEEDITAEELEMLEDASIEQQAEALNAAETDRQIDEDNLPEEDWFQDVADDPGEEEQSVNHPRK